MLAWIDLEMTGLDPSRDAIIEIAGLVTDNDLNIVAEGPDLVVAAPADLLASMEKVVRDMHARSGLLDEVTRSQLALGDAVGRALDFFRSQIPEPRSVPLCGNSIGTDRRFLAAHAPDLENFFHYRSIDVSTVKELARRWYPEALASAPVKKGGHRALDDIRESVDELRHYRQTIFRQPAQPAEPS